MPEGAIIGLGGPTSAVRNLHIPGSLVNTGNDYDLALVGRGWFQIETRMARRSIPRSGAFNTNATGQLVTHRRLYRWCRASPCRRRDRDRLHLVGPGDGAIANDTNCRKSTADDRQLRQPRRLEPMGENLFRQTPGVRGIRSSARRPIRASRRSSRTTWNLRTSTRSRKLPTSSRPSVPMR